MRLNVVKENPLHAAASVIGLAKHPKTHKMERSRPAELSDQQPTVVEVGGGWAAKDQAGWSG